jgi:fumarate hydratase subunit beta
MTASWLKLPVDPCALTNLSIGQWVNLSGSLYTARDAALKRVLHLVTEGHLPPVDFKGQTIYFVGPTPAAPGEPVGAAGPTTSRRMEKFIPILMELGVAAVIGKGPLSAPMLSEFQRNGVIYFSAAGGAGAFYGSKIRGSAVVAYEELGPEAMYCMHVENFPVVVAVDLKGGDLFAQGPQAYRKD